MPPLSGWQPGFLLLLPLGLAAIFERFLLLGQAALANDRVFRRPEVIPEWSTQWGRVELRLSDHFECL